MSSKKSEKSLECHKKYFHLQKKVFFKHKKKALFSILQHSALTRTCKSLLTHNRV